METLLATLSLALGAVVGDAAACVVAGVLVSEGRITLGAAFVGCFLGVLAGDIIWLLVGRMMGWGVADRFISRWVGSHEELAAWRNWVERHSIAAVFVSRFVPAVQTPLHILNGFLSRNLIRLGPALVVAAACYVAFWLLIARWIAARFDRFLDPADSLPWLVVMGLVAWGVLVVIGRLAVTAYSRLRR